MSTIFTSSVGKKFLMSLAGVFLLTFLVVHLGINSLLIIFDDPMVFNKAAHFMGTNIVIKVFEVILFGGFFLHIIYALVLQVQNWLARPKRYHKATRSQTSAFSRWMIHTAIIVLVFLVIHLIDFYFKAKFGQGHVAEIEVDGVHYHDLASLVTEKFQLPFFVILYLVSFIFLGFHLIHGFQSAFKTLGWNNTRINLVAQILSFLYTVVVVGGFASIPLIIFYK